MKFLLASLAALFVLNANVCKASSVSSDSSQFDDSESLSELMVDLLVSYHYDKCTDQELITIMEIVPEACWQIINEEEIKTILHQDDLALDELNYLKTKLDLKLKNYLTEDEIKQIVAEIEKRLE